MSGKAVISTLSIGGYSILAIPTQSVGGYSIPAIPTQSAAWRWLRGVAAWVWQGCHTLLLIHLRRPMRMSASTDADVCVDRCEPCREGFLALASGKAERRPALTTLLVLPYRNDQQCIIKKKSGATFMSHRFLCVYKYRLNGSINVFTLQGQGEPSILCLAMFLLLH